MLVAPPRNHIRCIRLVAALLFLLGIVVPVATAPAAVAATSTLAVTGHGFGHGRGLGQFGALGYAIDEYRGDRLGWTWQEITDHYYGGTHLASAANTPIEVLLRSYGTGWTIAVLEQGGLLTSVDAQLPGGPMAGRRAVAVDWVGGDNYDLYEGIHCGGGPNGWTYRGRFTATEIDIAPALQSDNRSGMVGACTSTGVRYVRGTLVADAFSTSLDGRVDQRTMNRLPVESYLRSVVPAESPASWGSLGGGRGMHALRAQAVAARSYALSGDNRFGSADTCDDTFCQVYRGHAFNASGTITAFESPNTDAAVAETAGQVRQNDANAAIARTEFSSSTGGWTAGGAFPAVPDAGDDTSGNPYHAWTRTIDVAALETAFDAVAGRDLGSFQRIEVTGRNGLGEDGGRVVGVRAFFSGGAATMTGDGFRSTFGLPSNWFSFPSAPSRDAPRPAGGYTLSADGSLTAFGGAPAATGTVSLGSPARAVDVGGPRGWGGYVVYGNGQIQAVNGAPAASSGLAFPDDWARDVIVRADGASGWVLDLFGGMQPFGGAPAVPISRYVGGADVARRMAVRPDGTSGWVLFADGDLAPFGGAPDPGMFALPSGTTAVAITLRDANSGWVLASNGVWHSFGGTPVRTPVPGPAIDADGSRSDAASGWILGNAGILVAYGGTPAVPAAGATRVGVAVIAEPAGYVLDQYGGLHPFGGAPRVTTSAYFGSNPAARAVASRPDGSGWVLTGDGALHAYGTVDAPAPTSVTWKWPGADFARDVVVLPSGTGGYVLDLFGGVHAFGSALPARSSFYRNDGDFARRIALIPDGSGAVILDAYGGLHPVAFGSAPMPQYPPRGPYWPGWDVARGLVLTSATSGMLLDAFGGVHSLGGAPAGGTWYSPGGAAQVTLAADGTTGWSGYVDGEGFLHGAPSTAPVATPEAYWTGWSVVRGVTFVRR